MRSRSHPIGRAASGGRRGRSQWPQRGRAQGGTPPQHAAAALRITERSPAVAVHSAPARFGQPGPPFEVHQDPVLSRVKLVAEPWDVGPAGLRSASCPCFDVSGTPSAPLDLPPPIEERLASRGPLSARTRRGICSAHSASASGSSGRTTRDGAAAATQFDLERQPHPLLAIDERPLGACPLDRRPRSLGRLVDQRGLCIVPLARLGPADTKNRDEHALLDERKPHERANVERRDALRWASVRSLSAATSSTMTPRPAR